MMNSEGGIFNTIKRIIGDQRGSENAPTTPEAAEAELQKVIQETGKAFFEKYGKTFHYCSDLVVNTLDNYPATTVKNPYVTQPLRRLDWAVLSDKAEREVLSKSNTIHDPQDMSLIQSRYILTLESNLQTAYRKLRTVLRTQE